MLVPMATCTCRKMVLRNKILLGISASTNVALQVPPLPPFFSSPPLLIPNESMDLRYQISTEVLTKVQEASKSGQLFASFLDKSMSTSTSPHFTAEHATQKLDRNLTRLSPPVSVWPALQKNITHTR